MGVKKQINRVLKPFGYTLSKRRGSEEALYEEVSPQARADRRFVNVGAGAFRHRYWTNLDFASEWYREAQGEGFTHYDLTACEPFPFESESIEAVYTSHTVEHVPDASVDNLIRESFRVLRPNGVLRVTCPDARLLVRSVRLGRLEYWAWRRKWFLNEKYSTAEKLGDVELADYLVREVATSRCRFSPRACDPIAPTAVMERLEGGDESLLSWLVEGIQFDSNYPGDHMNWWTFEKLEVLATAAGFRCAYRSGRGQSLCRPMCDPTLFDTTQPQNSLFFEAIKQ